MRGDRESRRDAGQPREPREPRRHLLALFGQQTSRTVLEFRFDLLEDCYGALDRAGWRVVEKSQTKIPPQWSKTVVSTTKAVLFLPARTCTPP